jgi:hypothetical protein
MLLAEPVERSRSATEVEIGLMVSFCEYHFYYNNLDAVAARETLLALLDLQSVALRGNYLYRLQYQLKRIRQHSEYTL